MLLHKESFIKILELEGKSTISICFPGLHGTLSIYGNGGDKILNTSIENGDLLDISHWEQNEYVAILSHDRDLWIQKFNKVINIIRE